MGIYRKKQLTCSASNMVDAFVAYCSVMGAEGSSLMMKLERDQMQITPRNCRTFKSMPREVLMAKL